MAEEAITLEVQDSYLNIGVDENGQFYIADRGDPNVVTESDVHPSEWDD